MHWLYVSIDVPAAEAGEAGRFWSQALGWELGDPWRGHREFRSLTPRDGDGYAHLQQTGNSVSAVHFDIGTPDVSTEGDRLLALGATQVADHDIWRVLTSPGGLDFCLVPSEGETSPGPTTWLDGHRSRLVQVCIDAPAELIDIELEFWRQATEWDFRPSNRDEFVAKLTPPPPGPVQLLFQRLGDDDSAGRVRAHIDLGADDTRADAARLVDLGATDHGAGDGWILMADPNGMPFCVTENDPT